MSQRQKAKTLLCKSFTTTGSCKFGKMCTFAHGVTEQSDLQRRKIHPCWWFNQGGCVKTAEECSYRHERVENLRKPLHLQHPCIQMHVKTPGKCSNGKGCGGDHNYELTFDEWRHHFPNYEYKGAGYLTVKSNNDFPPLSNSITINNRASMSAWKNAVAQIKTPPTKEQLKCMEQKIIINNNKKKVKKEMVRDSDEESSSESENQQYFDENVNEFFNVTFSDEEEELEPMSTEFDEPVYNPPKHLQQFVNNALKHLLQMA